MSDMTAATPPAPPPRRAPFNQCVDLLLEATDAECLEVLWALQAMGLRPAMNQKGQKRG